MGEVRLNVAMSVEEADRAKVRLFGPSYDRSIPGNAAAREGKHCKFLFDQVPAGMYTATLSVDDAGDEQVIFRDRVLEEPPPPPPPPTDPRSLDSPAARLQAAGPTTGAAGSAAGAKTGAFVPADPPKVGTKFCTICRRPIATSAKTQAAEKAGFSEPENTPDGGPVAPTDAANRYDFYRTAVESVGRFTTAPGRVNVVGVRGFVEGRVVANLPDKWNDTIALVWIDKEGKKQVREYLASVEPIKAGPTTEGDRRHLLDGQWRFRRNEFRGRTVLAQAGPVAVHNEVKNLREVGDFNIMIHESGPIEPGEGEVQKGTFTTMGTQLVKGTATSAVWTEFLNLIRADVEGQFRYTLIDGKRVGKDGKVGAAEAAARPETAQPAVDPTKPLAVKSAPSANKGDRQGHPIELVVLYHSGHLDTAKQIAWYQNPASKASVHYSIDPAGTIHQLVEDKDAAWHAGKAMHRGKGLVNLRSLGIELVGMGDTKDFAEAQYKALAGLLRRAFDAYGLTFDDLVGHQHIAPTRKGGPGRLFDWNRLRRLMD